MGSDIFVILLKVKEQKTRWYNMIFFVDVFDDHHYQRGLQSDITKDFAD